jgi:uncharacterized protein (TIGR02678 family)
MSNLHNVVVNAEKEEVARGIRILLHDPLITVASDSEGFDLLRRRSQPIAIWFDYTCGWSLIAEPRLGYVRLVKLGAGRGADASRPARRVRSGRAPFDRRRYTLLCVVAAEVMLTPVTTIGILADRVAQACAADEALPSFDSSNRRERTAFVDVVELLESYAVLTSTDGSTESFIETADAKVLYTVDGPLLSRLLAATTGPSQFAVPAEEIPSRFDDLLTGLTVESRYGDIGSASDGHAGIGGGSEVQRNLWLRHSILRRLFDEPVLYRDELSQPQRDYLASLSGRRILLDAVQRAGFELEERAEGWLLIDPDGLATDTKFPDGASTAKTAALVLLDWLLPRPEGATAEEWHRAAENILVKAPGWAKSYRSEGGAHRLAADAADVLGDFKLARWRDDRLTALPAAARYRSAVVSGDDFEASEGLW